jgi:DNA-binding transcriptional MocR family regulator
VSNPTSTILTNARKHKIVRLMNQIAKTHGKSIPVIFDQAYTGLIHDPEVEVQESVFREDVHDLVYEIGTLSKILAPSFRLGYVIGKASPLLAAIQERNSDVGFSASPLNQSIAAVMLAEVLQQQQSHVLAGYRIKAQAMIERMDQQLGPYLETYSGGRAGFYFYLTFKNIETHPNSDFYRYLHRTTGIRDIDGEGQNGPPRVAYIPGSFCVLPEGALHEVGNRSLRISYGFETMEHLLISIDLIAEAAAFAISRR